MNIQLYLQEKLEKCAAYNLIPQDKEILDKFGVEEFIFLRLTSTKFRKRSIDQDTQNKIREIIRNSFSQNQPIKFVFPFGGYKLWRLPTSPETDWAEFFSVAYCLEYLSPLAVIYKPGFELCFTSDEIIIERMDNVPQSETNKYTSSFKILLDFFVRYLPTNIQIEFKLIRDLYEPKEFETELQKLLPKNIETEWDKQPKEQQEKRYIMSKFNIKMKGKKNWMLLSKNEIDRKIKLGSLLHDAYIQLPKRVMFVKGSDKIVVFAFNIPGIACIPIGSTKTSVTKFWTGFGVLEENDNQLQDRILSPEQFEKAKTLPHEIVKTNLIPISNFREIWVYPQPFDFNQRG